MARYSKREFQVGRYWLDQRDGSPAWYRCWLEGSRTKRASLGTTDRGEAERLLTEFFIREHQPVKEAPKEALLADVLRRYHENHGGNVRSWTSSKTSLNYWLDFWTTASVDEVGDVKRQEEFHAFLRGQGLKDSSVMRTITVGKAALNRAWKRGELKSVPYILTVKSGPAAPMGRPMEVPELRRLYQAAQPHLQIFIGWMLGTAARPEAILDLRSEQVDREHGLIALNPPGRQQTKKHRPTVRLIPSLAECVFDGPLVVTKSAAVKSVKKAWNVAREQAGLDKRVNAYSLRHTAARWMRKHGVSNEEVGQQIGHRRLGTTAIYTEYDPAYLKNAAAALDELVRAVCTSMPVRKMWVAERGGKPVQRDAWVNAPIARQSDEILKAA